MKDATKKKLKKMLRHDFYKQQIEEFSSESLSDIVFDRQKALDCAKKAVEQTEPEKLTKKYVDEVAEGMQAIAKLILVERVK